MSDPARPTLSVVDPHVHVWDVGSGLYPRRAARGAARTAMSGDYLLDDLLADAGAIHIAKAVHIEATATDGLAEARHVQAIADAAPSGIPQGIVAGANLADPGVAAILAELAKVPNVRGIRHTLNRPGESRDFLGESAWRRGFALLSGHGLSFDLQVSPHQMPAAARLAAEHPQTAVILGHAGMFSDRTVGGWRAWRDGLRLLAGCDNVWIKISGMGMFDPGWTVESLRPYVFETLDAFGTDRAMFASNFPVDKRASGYGVLWQAFATIVKDLTGQQQIDLLGGNAERFYRI